jgi:betaine lipid synthase
MLGLSAFVPRDPFHQLTVTLCIVGLFLAVVFVYASRPKSKDQAPSTLEAYLKFIYGCFLKPHTGDGTGSQQDALVCGETFRTRTRLTKRTGELL